MCDSPRQALDSPRAVNGATAATGFAPHQPDATENAESGPFTGSTCAFVDLAVIRWFAALDWFSQTVRQERNRKKQGLTSP
jgi:hypothetical protein